MSDEDRKDNPGFVIKDRRRFDESGNERPLGEDSREASEKPSPERSDKRGNAVDASAQPAAEGEAGTGLSEIDFSSFVMSLATQALMQLGEIKPPPGVEIEADRSAAKQTIDILGMLESKTRGNLDNDEKHLLEEILRNLRLSFVRAVK